MLLLATPKRSRRGFFFLQSANAKAGWDSEGESWLTQTDSPAERLTTGWAIGDADAQMHLCIFNTRSAHAPNAHTCPQPAVQSEKTLSDWCFAKLPTTHLHNHSLNTHARFFLPHKDASLNATCTDDAWTHQKISTRLKTHSETLGRAFRFHACSSAPLIVRRSSSSLCFLGSLCRSLAFVCLLHVLLLLLLFSSLLAVYLSSSCSLRMENGGCYSHL